MKMRYKNRGSRKFYTCSVNSWIVTAKNGSKISEEMFLLSLRLLRLLFGGSKINKNLSHFDKLPLTSTRKTVTLEQ